MRLELKQLPPPSFPQWTGAGLSLMSSREAEDESVESWDSPGVSWASGHAVIQEGRADNTDVSPATSVPMLESPFKHPTSHPLPPGLRVVTI